MSSLIQQSTFSILLFALLTPSTLASPILLPRYIRNSIQKRTLSPGARAGMGIGIAIVALIGVGLIIFFAVHVARQRHNAALNNERAILAGEKNQDGSDKLDKFAPEPPITSGMPRRNKSVKDRLMGPLYRGSTIELPQRAAQRDSQRMEGAHWTEADGQPILHKPWAESSPRPSFSSKRATRMMMMM